MTDPERVQAVFLAAVEHTLPNRTPFLDRECGSDSELRSRVEALLKAHDEPGSFLENPAAEVIGTADMPMLTEKPGTEIGPYKLLQQIGEGGFGVVHMAEQQKPIRRRVALKIIKPGMDTREVIARFEAERQALALMDHPNIAHVLDAGATESGRPFFAMELVKGVTITEYCDQCHLTTRERLDLFVSVCQAVQHAHQKGIIHRDIKPSNVMITLHDGSPVVKVIDFGVAKAINQHLTEQTLFTNFAQMIGTPLYMSPEQAELSGLDVDTRTDIYSLGVLLYELLTGVTPFEKKRLREAAYDEIRRIIRDEEPPKPSARITTLGKSLTTVAERRHADPRKLSQLLRGDLDWIVMKSLEKNRTRRYGTASDFASDVVHYLNYEPVLASPPSAVYWFRKFARRNKAVLAATAAIVAALLLGTAVSTWQAVRATQAANDATAARGEAQAASHRVLKAHKETEREREEAVRQRDEAARQRDETRRYLYVAHMNLAQRAWEESNVGRVLELLEGQKPEQTGGVDLRGWEWHYQWRLSHSELRTLKHPSRRVIFSPDGKLLASGGNDGTVKLWDPASGQEISTLAAHSGQVRGLAFSPDGQILASGGFDGPVTLWDAASGQKLRTLKAHTDKIKGIVFSPDGRLLASGSTDGTVKLWDSSNGQLLRTLNASRYVFSVAFSPDGKRLVSGGGYGTVKLWDTASGQELRSHKAHASRVFAVAFCPDGQLLASGGRDGIVKLWDPVSGQEQWTQKASSNGVFGVGFSPDGKLLASASSSEGVVRLWETASGQLLRTLKGHTGFLHDVAFSPGGQLLASGSGSDGTVRIWSAARNQEFLTFKGHRAYVHGVAFSPDGQLLASADRDGIVKLWDAASGHELRTLKGHTNHARSVEFSPDGRLLASGSTDNTVKLWDPASGQELRTLKGHTSRVYGVAFSPDGQRLASGSGDAAVKLWDAESGQELRTLKGHTIAVHNVAFSPDGQLLASSDRNGVVMLWDATSGQSLRTLNGHSSAVHIVVFSPDGRLLGSAGADGWINVWDAAIGHALLTLKGHSSTVESVAFSPDGERLASCGADATMKLWDLTSGQELRTLKAHTDTVTGVAFSPDGQRLASCSKDRTIKIWDARPLTAELRAELLAFDLLESLGGKSLSNAEVIRQIRDRRTLAKPVRQRALDLAESNWEREVSRQASDLVTTLFDKMHLKEEVINAIRADDAIQEQVRQKALEFAQQRRQNPHTLSELADRLAQAGKHAEAEKIYRQSLILGDKHIDGSPNNRDDQIERGHTFWRLGTLLRGTKRYDDAEQAFLEALAIFKQLSADFPDHHFSRLEWGFSHWQLGWLLDAVGRHAEAEEYWREGLDVYANALEDFSGDEEFQERLTQSHDELARNLIQQGKQPEAEKLLRERVEFLRELHGESDQRVAEALQRLTSLIDEQNKHAEDEKRLIRRLKSLRKRHGDQHPAVARCLKNLAKTLAAVGKSDEGHKLFEQAIGVWRNVLQSAAQTPSGELVFVDLESHANQPLTEDISFVGHIRGNDLAEVPRGEHSFAGVRFHVGEKLIHLGGKELPDRPMSVEGIMVRQPVANLHFLHSAQWGGGKQQFGKYRVNFADGSTEEIPIIGRTDVRDWWQFPGGRLKQSNAVWVGANEASRQQFRFIHLSLTTWENPHPEREVASIDYFSANTRAAPFCVAITVELPTTITKQKAGEGSHDSKTTDQNSTEDKPAKPQR
jgi:WD40 repeat protein/serine/threonine protein kinase/tetratricopeptide (TPR) repeat protein